MGKVHEIMLSLVERFGTLYTVVKRGEELRKVEEAKFRIHIQKIIEETTKQKSELATSQLAEEYRLMELRLKRQVAEVDENQRWR